MNTATSLTSSALDWGGSSVGRHSRAAAALYHLAAGTMCAVAGSAGHCNPRGLRSVGRAVADALTDPTLFDAGPRTGVSVWGKTGDAGACAHDPGTGSA